MQEKLNWSGNRRFLDAFMYGVRSLVSSVCGRFEASLNQGSSSGD